MEIIISSNAKLNSHIHQTKLSIRELDDKITRGGSIFTGSGGLSVINKDGAPTNIDTIKTMQKVNEMDTEIEKLRLDIISSKQNEKMR